MHWKLAPACGTNAQTSQNTQSHILKHSQTTECNFGQQTSLSKRGFTSFVQSSLAQMSSIQTSVVRVVKFGQSFNLTIRTNDLRTKNVRAKDVAFKIFPTYVLRWNV